VAAVPGKNLGLTASLINVIVPVIAVVAIVAYFVSVFSEVLSSIGTSTPNLPSTTLANGFGLGIIALGIISFISLILFIVSMYQLSHYYNEPGIFTNVIIGFIITIVGSIISYILAFVYVSSVANQFAGLNASSATPSITSAAMQLLAALAAILIIIFVIAIVSSIFYMRAFNKLADKSEVGSFHTAGLLYLIGTVLTILGIGIILIWIGWIYAASGYHALKPKQEPIPAATYTYPPPPNQTTSTATYKRCPYCGADNNPNAMYCRNCGKPI
jgi:uncharacterized membrane protein